MLLGLLVLLTGCSLGGADPDYWIEFTVDGTTYVFTEGYPTGPADVAGGCLHTTDSKTRLAAVKADDSREVTLTFKGTDTGTYSDLQINFSTTVRGGLQHNSIVATPFNLTVTEYGPVGGVIRGTFSGQVKEQILNDPQTYDLTVGTFRVKRQANDSIDFK